MGFEIHSRRCLCELPQVEAELLQDRGVDVGDIVAVLDGMKAELIGRAVYHAPLIP